MVIGGETGWSSGAVERLDRPIVSFDIVVTSNTAIMGERPPPVVPGEIITAPSRRLGSGRSVGRKRLRRQPGSEA